MKKSELKTGMILEFEDCNFAIVLLGTNDGDIFSGANWGFLNEYDEDLNPVIETKNEIVKIYQPTCNWAYINGINENPIREFKLLWSKKDK